MTSLVQTAVIGTKKNAAMLSYISVEGPVLFTLFLDAMMEVAFPEEIRFHREMGVKLEVARGDITDLRSFGDQPSSGSLTATTYGDDIYCTCVRKL